MKGKPPQLRKKKWDMLRIMEPIHQMGKIVTHDSGLCVTASILELHNFGFYGQALIKKWGRYWPCNVPRNFIDEHFHDKDWFNGAIEANC